MEEWKKKRTKTFIAFTLVEVVLGMEYSMIVPTVYLYLTTLIHSSYPFLFYGLISASFHMTNILSGILLGRISDKTRKIWLIHQCGNMLIMLGNFFYAFPFSSLFPLSGRILSGFGAGLRAVIYGEIGRVYDTANVSRCIAITSIGSLVGYTLGPMVNILFANVDFYIGDWHINYTNMPGVYMTIICFINQFILFFMVHDLSLEFKYIELYSEVKIFDNIEQSDTSTPETELLKNYESLNNLSAHDLDFSTNTAQDITGKTQHNSNGLPSQRFIWLKLLSSVDWTLLMISTFVFGFTNTASDMWYPLVVINELQWGKTAFNCVLIEIGIIAIPVLAFAAWKKLTNRIVFYSYTASVLFQISVFVILLILKKFHKSFVINVALLGTYGFVYAISLFMHQLPAITLTQMVPSSSQGYVQGIHQGFFRVGASLGFFLPPLIYNWLFEDVIVIVVVSTVLLFALIARRRGMLDPQLLF